ncbi:GumC family protein [Roseovarius ramblicola]|uniref:non-specific protein-tyrosine kinase n=1 Tax=Roseovarius ramblicola TaxID=2022336 RepID=A0ABV5HX85_9RHOB
MPAHHTQTAGDDDEIDLMELFRALWRGKWLIALSALVALVLGGYYAVGVAEPQYRATAQLTLEVRTGQVVDLESVMTGVSTEQAALNTEIEIITSRRILGKLVDTLDLAQDPEFNTALEPPSALARIKGALAGMLTGADGAGAAEGGYEKSPRDRAIDALRERLSASVQRDTYVFNISATTGDAEKSARILNMLADLYLQEQIAVKFEATEQAVAWLSKRVTELEADLREKEDTLKAARAETELISPEALEGLNLQAKTLRERLEEMRAGVEAAQAELDRLTELRAAGNRAAAVEATGDATLRRLLQSLREGETDAGGMFDQRLEALVSRAASGYDRQLSQVNALAESYRTLQERIERQSADLVRIEQMRREVETTRTLYETFLTRLKETTVQRGLQQADSRVLSDAIPGEKVAPRTSLILALSMVLGLMAGAAIVLVRQFLHDTFRAAADIEAATGLPVLGQIPKMPVRERKDLIGYLKDRPTSAPAEAIRNLRTSLLLSDIDHPPQIIMSTSALPGEGKTTQAVALAQNLAGLDKSVLLIEGDIRRRTFAQYFSDVPAGGVLTALSGEVPLNEVVFHDERLGADILMGEKSRANAADLFSSDKFRAFLARAREAYDFVIIDTPPVLVVPDARVIGQHADAILFSVAWDSTQRGQVLAALREFESANLGITGIALAQIDPKGMRRYGYGGKYGAYGAYGQGYYDAG